MTSSSKKRVALFATCLGDELYPDVLAATERVLTRLGCEVTVPAISLCCGQPAFNSGYEREAERVARTWLSAYSGADYVVAPSGSCVGMVHHNYARLFSHDAQLASAVAQTVERTFEFSQFVVEILGVEALDASFPHRVTYHASCHAARLLGLKQAPVSLLGAVPDLELVPLPRVEDCCGFGGSFSVKLSGISTAIADEKVDHVQSTGAHYVTSTDLGCLMNIGGRMERRGLAIRTLHLAELLDRALGFREGRAS